MWKVQGNGIIQPVVLRACKLRTEPQSRLTGASTALSAASEGE